MTEPITAALIVGLAAQKFAEGAAGKTAEKLIEKLWNAIANRFKGRKKVEEAIGQIQASRDPAAMTKLEKVLDGEFVEDEEFEAELKGLAQQIINIDQSQNQAQEQITIEVNARDSARVNAVGKLDAETVNFGDRS